MNDSLHPSASAGSWLEGFLLDLLGTDTAVRPGATEVEPGAPHLLHAIDELILPRLAELHPDEIRQHPAGDIAARFGPDRPDGVLLQTYLVSQHGNLMADPHQARILDGADFDAEGPCAVGQGASQNKGAMAAAFAAVSAVRRQLAKPIWLTINTEGRSSHGGSQRLIDELKLEGASGVVAIGTDLKVSVGNRGRVDIHIVVDGKSCHSSQPWLGLNPIEIAADLVEALRRLPLPSEHPDLGPASAIPYQLICDPIAPHTIPSKATLVIDRRLLPGEGVTEAVNTIDAYLKEAVKEEFEVVVGAYMLPAVVDPKSLLVQTLIQALERQGQVNAPLVWSRNTFDAGYACARGIPTCMFGPGRRSFGEGVTSVEWVSLADCETASATLADALEALTT